MAPSGPQGSLVPQEFDALISENPTLKKLVVGAVIRSLEPARDSSEMGPKDYMRLRDLILSIKEDHFIVIHGTDTMAYTASAISFLLRGLGKKVIFTGAQIPIGMKGSDALDNLALAQKALLDLTLQEEVVIAFGGKLVRGNRAEKSSATALSAFDSPHYPALYIDQGKKSGERGLHVEDRITTISGVCDRVMYFPVYPGISYKTYVNCLVDAKPRGIILGTYGGGNIPSSASFQMVLKNTIQKGIPVLAISQNYQGTVDLGTYESGQMLRSLGVISGKDMTLPAALTKMMVLLGEERGADELKLMLGRNLAGEMTDE